MSFDPLAIYDVFVTVENGTRMTQRVRGDYLSTQLKQLLFAQSDLLAIDRQCIRFNENDLDDKQTLAEQGVAPNSQLSLQMAPLGPGAMVKWFGGDALGLSAPLGLTLDMTRKPFRLAVADSGSHRLLVFKYPVLQLAYRHGVAHKPSPLPEHLNAPHACALSSTGSRWYIADTGNHRILVLDADTGAVEASIGQHCGLREGPRGVALAKHSDSIASDVASLDQRGACTIRGAALADRLWVASSSTHTVQCFDLSGRAPRLALELGGGKDTPSRQADMQSFRWPMGLACFGGRVFVADRGNDRVQVLDEASGGHRYTITGSRSARLLKPEGVAVDRRRSVLYVSDTGNQCICAFDATPPFAFRGRTLGDRVEGLQHMAVDESSGELICSDAKQNRILVFNPI